jgi:hypothetical protein
MRALWIGGFCVAVSMFFGYFVCMIVAPMVCGWCEEPSNFFCRILPFPLRSLIFSELVFIEIVGFALLVGGVLILVKK